jgi:hypothetical protein
MDSIHNRCGTRQDYVSAPSHGCCELAIANRRSPRPPRRIARPSMAVWLVSAVIDGRRCGIPGVVLKAVNCSSNLLLGQAGPPPQPHLKCNADGQQDDAGAGVVRQSKRGFEVSRRRWAGKSAGSGSGRSRGSSGWVHTRSARRLRRRRRCGKQEARVGGRWSDLLLLSRADPISTTTSDPCVSHE